jgi:hypothetical protein
LHKEVTLERIWSIPKEWPFIYRPRSPWGPLEAFAVTALIVALGQFLLPLCFYGLSPNIFSIISKQLGPPKFGYGDYPIIYLIEQITTTVLVVIAAGMRGGRRSAVLSLGPAKGGFVTA